MSDRGVEIVDTAVAHTKSSWKYVSSEGNTTVRGNDDLLRLFTSQLSKSLLGPATDILFKFAIGSSSCKYGDDLPKCSKQNIATYAQ